MAIIDSILAVFLQVATWFGNAFDAIVPMFWTAAADGGELTFLGTLAIAGLAVATTLLLLRIVTNFLNFRS